jgi:hypothetical protein
METTTALLYKPKNLSTLYRLPGGGPRLGKKKLKTCTLKFIIDRMYAIFWAYNHS